MSERRDGRPILLLGADGQLGRELRRTLPALGPVVAVGRAELDLGDVDAVRRAVSEARPRALVNAAAYTAVDRAESEPAVAHAINATAPGVLAEAAEGVGAPLLHFSTDYVFDGGARTPYAEDAAPGPLNVYGASKLAGDQAVLARCARPLVLRTSWVYSAGGRNFLDTMLRLAAAGRPVVRVVDDQRGAPTSAEWLAEAATAILGRALDRAAAWGTWHVSAGGETTWHDFAAAIFDGVARRGHAVPSLERTSTAAYGSPARRPAYSVLDSSRARRTFDLAIPDWAELLARVLDARLGPASRPAPALR